MAPHEGDAPSHSSSESVDDDDDEMHFKHQSRRGSSPDQPHKMSDKPSRDPSRPKRKKARRACMACQRAHLTCGDERPCYRCVKRNLQDSCHDGMRKKAKYLHDAPPGALAPGYAANNHSPIACSNGTSQHLPVNVSGPEHSHATNLTQTFSSPLQSQAPMGPPMQEPPNYPYLTAQSPPDNNYNDVQNYPASLPLGASSTSMTPQSFNPLYYDAMDPASFNFDLASMNFGNHYGALEFGMLGHMSSGANDTPGFQDHHRRPSTGGYGPAGFSPGFVGPINESGGYRLDRDGFAAWANPSTSNGIPAHPSVTRANNIGMDFRRDSQDSMLYFNGGLPLNSNTLVSQVSYQDAKPDQAFYTSSSHDNAPNGNTGLGSPPSVADTVAPAGVESQGPGWTRRWRNPSEIYSGVTKPYPYTAGFHALKAVFSRRFAIQQRLRIAQALASIRPSFISCTRTLTDADLTFMEQSFQRTLCEYESHVFSSGTPTVICRRTGEVVLAGQEFTVLTGWTRDVLLGDAPNLNANTGGNNGQLSGTATGNSTHGFSTPAIVQNENALKAEGRPQPVFLAELLDDDDVVRFFEDFAKLAFVDSQGSVSSRCKVLKYRTNEEILAQASICDSADPTEDDQAGANGTRRELANSRMKRLGEKDGKLDCMFCWTVKRDMFDIPMMIVINFLPIV